MSSYLSQSLPLSFSHSYAVEQTTKELKYTDRASIVNYKHLNRMTQNLLKEYEWCKRKTNSKLNDT